MVFTFRSLRILLTLLLLALAFCNAQEQPDANSAGSQSHSPRTLGKKKKVDGIGNFGEVTPTLFRGAQPTEAGLEALEKMGIAIVVNARGDRDGTEEKEVRALGMQYVSIPWHCPFPHDDVFVRFLKVLQDNPDKKVFVHCQLGEDRTGMMIASYRMAEQDWSADEARLEMQRFGFSRAHHFICPGLGAYERSFPARLKSNPAFEELRPGSQHDSK